MSLLDDFETTQEKWLGNIALRMTNITYKLFDAIEFNLARLKNQPLKPGEMAILGTLAKTFTACITKLMAPNKTPPEASPRMSPQMQTLQDAVKGFTKLSSAIARAEDGL